MDARIPIPILQCAVSTVNRSDTGKANAGNRHHELRRRPSLDSRQIGNSGVATHCTSSSGSAWRTKERRLAIEYTLIDPKGWEGEWKMTKHWNRVDDRDIAEVECLPDLNEHMPTCTRRIKFVNVRINKQEARAMKL